MNVGIISTVLLPLALAIIMFGLGLSLKINDFKRIFQYPKAVVTGSFTQLVLLPVLGFGIAAMLLSHSPELAIGLVILAMCPGGPTANLITHLANGDTALCISLTAISSIVKIFTIPLMVNFAIQKYMGTAAGLQLDVVSSIIKIITITLVPAALGMLVKARFAGFAQAAQKPVKILSAVFLVLVIVAAIFQERATIARSFSIAGPAALLLNISGMALGYFIPQLLKLPVTQRITISIETSIQNGTLAIAIASSPLMLNNSTMAIPAVVYSIIMFITAGIFVGFLNRKRKAAESPAK
ncbi:MAG: bile acid:sodium symporter family protein [Chitinophagaceae bacterium]|nr:bile acid:sodium symporter family protein [Chitinophagaceae bacterium]MCW5929841.1 bile acid:sodium symporter family protein [Chitinophagaceae bacterium]